MVDFNKKLDEALESAKRDKKPTVHYTTQTLESDRPLAICGIRATVASSTENPEAVTCGRCLKKLSKNPDTGDKQMPEETEVQASPIQLMSEGVELDTAVTIQEAMAKAQDISDSLGGTEIEIVQDSVIIDRVGVPAEEEEPEVEEEEPEPKKTVAKKGNVIDMKTGKEKVNGKVAAKKVAPAKKDKAVKEKADCVCGCGTKTGGNFAPGHDGRVHGWMKKVAAGTMKLKELPESAQKYIKSHSA